MKDMVEQVKYYKPRFERWIKSPKWDSIVGIGKTVFLTQEEAGEEIWRMEHQEDGR